MKVLFCTLDYAPSPAGGAERQAQLQAEGLAKRGHVVEVVCPRIGEFRSGRINGILVHRLPRLSRWPLRPISYLLLLGAFLLLRLRRYDLVHVHLANLQADVAVAVARLLNRPSYLKLAAGGPLGEIGRLKRVALVTRFYGIRHANLVQAISAEIADDVMGLGVPPSRIIRIPNGMVAPGERPTDADRAAARDRLGFRGDRLLVLFAGRLEREKGVEDLLAAWERPAIASSATLLLLGSPGLKHPVDLNGLPPNAEHRPWSSDIDSYLTAADIFVLPSYAEGMSNALLEAMSMGLPCIASRVGAAPEMIVDGQSGLLVEPGDRDALAGALETLAADPMLRFRLGAAARDSVLERYEIEPVVTLIEAAYRSVSSAP
jgi:glycosyltransferase involved in cell wall biosynthesis